jgi:hypothetical protein
MSERERFWKAVNDQWQDGDFIADTHDTGNDRLRRANPAAGEWCSDMSKMPKEAILVLLDTGIVWVAQWYGDYGNITNEETVGTEEVVAWARINPPKGEAENG